MVNTIEFGSVRISTATDVTFHYLSRKSELFQKQFFHAHQSIILHKIEQQKRKVILLKRYKFIYNWLQLFKLHFAHELMLEQHCPLRLPRDKT